MNGWISIEHLLDSFKQRQQALRLDETVAHHRVDVEEVFAVRTFQLRKRLRVEIEVMEVDDSVAGDERAPVLPSGQGRYKVRRRSQFHVDVQALLDVGDGAQYSIACRDDGD